MSATGFPRWNIIKYDSFICNFKHSFSVIDYMSQGLQIEEIIDFFNMQIQYQAINR